MVLIHSHSIKSLICDYQVTNKSYRVNIWQKNTSKEKKRENKRHLKKRKLVEDWEKIYYKYCCSTTISIYKVRYVNNCEVSIIFNYLRFISEDLRHIKLYLSAQILQLSSRNEILFTGEDVNSFLCWVRWYDFSGRY